MTRPGKAQNYYSACNHISNFMLFSEKFAWLFLCDTFRSVACAINMPWIDHWHMPFNHWNVLVALWTSSPQVVVWHQILNSEMSIGLYASISLPVQLLLLEVWHHCYCWLITIQYRRNQLIVYHLIVLLHSNPKPNAIPTLKNTPVYRIPVPLNRINQIIA